MIAAFFDGVRRVAAAPTLTAGMYLVTLLAAVPLALVMHDAIASHLGSSVAADAVATGANWEWWEEFGAQSHGIEETLTPTVIGFGAVLSNLSALADGRTPNGAVTGLAIIYLGAWAFLVGGVLDRLARRRRVSSVGFFSACGVYFFRFLRLALLAGLAYWLVLGPVRGWLLDDLYPFLTRDVTVERTAFLLWVGLSLPYVALLLLVNVILDYAKIRAVVEDRRSMIGALLAAVRFIGRRPLACAGLYGLNGAVFLGILAVYAVVAPGASLAGPGVWVGFLIGQAYVVARLFAKLVFFGSQIAYFQSQLAHAGYVAAPRQVWPESPLAEAIGDA